jgi:hypothetical protein
MPRKDGKLTAAELRAQERVAGNAEFIGRMSDDDLANFESGMFASALDDEVIVEQLRAERARRGITR